MHRWSYDDDVVAFYLYRFGDKDLPIWKTELAEKLGMGWGSMGMRIGNFKSLDGQPGLDHPAKQSRVVYERYKNMSDAEFKRIVHDIVARVIESSRHG